MERCEKENCHKEAVSLVARPDGDVQMCWDCHQDYEETEADFIAYQLEDR